MLDFLFVKKVIFKWTEPEELIDVDLYCEWQFLNFLFELQQNFVPDIIFLCQDVVSEISNMSVTDLLSSSIFSFNFSVPRNITPVHERSIRDILELNMRSL